MIVVADASPIMVLVNIQLTDLLPTLFGNVIIPDAVALELASVRRPDPVRLFIGSPPAWLEVRTPSTFVAIDGLHDGESAAIALAMELGADRLIIDDASGRKIAVEKGIKVVGTVGLLETAAARDLIALEAVFQSLSQTDFWLPEGFLNSRLDIFRKKYPHKK